MTSPTHVVGWCASLLLTAVHFAVSAAAYSQPEDTAETIHIAAYEFPPYFSSNLEEHLLGAVVEALNQRQQHYQFRITEVRPANRYRALTSAGCCDLMFFQDPQWGWDNANTGSFVTGRALTKGADLYLALTDPLQALQAKATIGGVQGYHYQLTGYQHDLDILEQDHNLYLADNHLTLLNMLRRERLDVVIINQEMVRFMHNEPEYNPLLADLDYQTAVDQEYETHIIGRQGSAELIAWVESELVAMWHEGELEALFKHFGLEDHLYLEQTISPREAKAGANTPRGLTFQPAG